MAFYIKEEYGARPKFDKKKKDTKKTKVEKKLQKKEILSPSKIIKN